MVDRSAAVRVGGRLGLIHTCKFHKSSSPGRDEPISSRFDGPAISMPTEKAIALVLRVVEFSETSSIVTLLTREFGKVRGLAKGARRPKGPFESALDLLSLCRIVFLRKSSDALDLLTEAKLEWRFRAGTPQPVKSLRRLLRRRIAERTHR